MGLLKEVALGLVLLMGGESDEARRAGDALLAGRIQLAIENGGFQRLEYGSWHRVPGHPGHIGFSDISIERDHGLLSVETAVVDALSYDLVFERGEFSSRNATRQWLFDSVNIESSGIWSNRLRLVANNLRPGISGAGGNESPADPDPGGCDPGLHSLECRLRNAIDHPIDGVSMAFSEAGKHPVTLIIASQGRCTAASTQSLANANAFQVWGRAYLHDPATVVWKIYDVSCESRWFDADVWISPEQLNQISSITMRGDQLLAQAPVLLETLFSLVAESYAYLLE